VARALLLATGVAWLVAGLAGLAFAALGTEMLERALPPLVIDTDALRGAIVAVAVGLAVVGAAHLAVVAALRAGHRVAWTVGILMTALLCATLVAVAAAAATSAVADPSRALAYLAGTAGSAAGAVAYGLVAARLVAERRAESVD
jgi:hypothetical protein